MQVNFYDCRYGTTSELKKLSFDTRNRLRAVMEAGDQSQRLLERLRDRLSAKEIAQVEKVIQEYSFGSRGVLPETFPTETQTVENYDRLKNLGLEKEVALTDVLVREDETRIYNVFSQFRELNELILSKAFEKASEKIGEIRSVFGHSSALLRKAAVLRSFSTAHSRLAEVEELLEEAGYGQNNIFLSSLINCYSENQDFLILKRSILNLPNRGRANRYTRDICRIPFHPIAKNEADLSEMIQSGRQSSLIDAVLTIKANENFVQKHLLRSKALKDLCDHIDSLNPDLNEIAALYYETGCEEEEFYRHSSAWLELPSIISYRTLIDHFYDSPDSAYLDRTPAIVQKISCWASPSPLSALREICSITLHEFPALKSLESNGTVTRSALFNYFIHISSEAEQISDDDLLWLMGNTRDLSKTIDAAAVRKLIAAHTSKLAQLVFHFLVAKKSRNERDGFTLRKVFQDVVRKDYAGSIVGFIEAISISSPAVAVYAYEICTEDFIAKLYHIVTSAHETTEIRAALHLWMSRHTGEQSYADRARTLLIDHQLNKIRNEIDDYRIYVDAGRFAEWINDEVMRDLNAVLMSIEHKSALLDGVDPQIMQILEQCYSAFCSNSIFGIASYLGRRIRHGTFKGHLYFNLISVERTEKYSEFLADPLVSAKWARWKSEYEKRVDQIISERLHIESPDKRYGFLKISTATPQKYEALAACAKNIAKEFAESKSTFSVTSIITEYCWRIVENDLREINSYLKNCRIDLVNLSVLEDIKNGLAGSRLALARDFCRDLPRTIDEKLASVYNWFKKPANVSPKASLTLLYKAVIAEVQETFPDFKPEIETSANDEIELVGGAYHVLYDSFYVVVYNAAKHGKNGENLERNFNVVEIPGQLAKILELEMSSIIKDDQTEEFVSERLLVDKNDILSAQVTEDRSGIRKLYNLEYHHKEFRVCSITCHNRKVKICLIYELEH
jgi:hypothetical protein